MNEVEFRNWLNQQGTTKKVQSDIISRLRRVERELEQCDIDVYFENDKCSSLLSVFENKGENEAMKKYPHANFPVGKYYMSTFRHALKKYIQFREASR